MSLDGLELRLALRRLCRAPAFAISVILLFAISIGATTFTFSIVRALLFQSIPYSHAEQLVVLTPGAPRGEMVEELAQRRDLFEHVGAYVERAANLSGDGWSERVLTARVTPDFFTVAGTRARLGRLFVFEDFTPSHERVVVITDRMWRQRYGAAVDVAGQRLMIDGSPWTIVGVLPAAFRTLGQLERAHDVVADRDAQVVLPLRGSTHAIDPGSTDKVGREAQVLARLAPDVPVSRVNAALGPMLDAAQSRYRYPVAFRFKSLRTALAGQLPAQLALLGAAVVMLLLVGCANVLNLLLARVESRRGELAVCTALGAGSWRIISGVLVEVLILMIVGGIAGLVLAWQARIATRALAAGMLDLTAASLDTVVLLFTLGLCGAVVIAVGLVPGLSARTNPSRRLHAGPTQSRAANSFVRSWLVIGQTALAVALVIVGALLARAFLRLVDDKAGFATDGVLSAEISLSRQSDAPGMFFQGLLERTASISDIDGAAVVSTTPGGDVYSGTMVIVRGRPFFVDSHDVSGEYFRVLSIPMLAGGTFTPRDTRTTPLVAVVNESFARQYWGSAAEAVGQQFATGVPASELRGGIRAGAVLTVVGVVGDARDGGTEAAPGRRLYTNYMQGRRPSGQMTVLVRAAHRDASALAPALRQIVAGLDPAQPLYNVRPLAEIRRSRFARERVIATVMGAFSVMTLLVASLGVYAAMSYAGATRRHEIGVRLALGGSRWSIVRTIASSGAKLVGIGLEAGLVVAVITVAVLRASLFDSWHIDVMTTSAAVALVVVVAAVALLLPAVRATRLDPLQVLRE